MEWRRLWRDETDSVVNLPGAVKAAGSYRIPNVKIDSYAVYTNSVPCGHFRSPGMVQLVFAGESQMDMIAKSLQIDPLEIRIRNALQDGDPTPGENKHGLIDVKCRDVLEAAGEVSRWKTFIKAPHVGRGVALSYRNVGIGDANARLSLGTDGIVSLLITYADTGTGAHTILCQMIAEVLGIPFSQVKLAVGTTDTFPFRIRHRRQPCDLCVRTGCVEGCRPVKGPGARSCRENARRIGRRNRD